MKQAKKLLCMLLVMLLAFSTVSIGASAAWTDYKSKPESYNALEQPVLSTPARSSQLLDWLDEILAEENINEDYVVIKLNLTSIDNALDTIDDIKGATGLIGGDVADLNFDALGAGVRRGTSGKYDLDILYMLISFINDNRGIVARFIRGELDLGVIGSFVDLNFNVYTMLMDMLYENMIDSSVSTAPSGWTADKILQTVVDTYLLGGVDANQKPITGLLPGMAGKTNINTQSIWAIIENAANSATKDLLPGIIETELKPHLVEWEAEYPAAGWSNINIDNLNLANYTWGQYDSKNGVVAELNHFVYWLLDSVWTGEPFWVDGGNDKLQQNVESLLKMLYREFGNILLPASAELKDVAEVEAMNLQQLCGYIGKQFLASEMPEVFWDHFIDGFTAAEKYEPQNVAELACFVIYSFTADFLPTAYIEDVDMEYYEMNADYAISMLSDLGAYFLNAIIPINAGTNGDGMEALLTRVVNWALSENNFGGFFKGCNVQGADDVWTKIDKTVLTVLPLQDILGGNIQGSEDLIMNHLVNAIFNLDFEAILSLLYKSETSALHKTIPDFVVWLANNILNIVVAQNSQPAIIDTSLKTIDAIIQNNNLASMAERLLQGLHRAAGGNQYFWDSLFPILNPMLIDEKGYAYNTITPPSGYSINTLEGVQAQVDKYNALLTEPDDPYNTNSADWNESEDFKLFRYDKIEEAIDFAQGTVDGYNGAVQWVADANTRLAAAQQGVTDANATGDQTKIDEANAELTNAQNNLTNAQNEVASYTPARYANAAYEVDYYYNRACTVDRLEANINHLYNVIGIADVMGYNKKDYSADVWANYEKAYDHAVAVYDAPTVDDDGNLVKQSMVNAVRKNLIEAMRLLEVKLADVTELVALIEKVKGTVLDGYSQETIDAFTSALADAQALAAELLSIDRQDDVDSMINRLQAAFEGLAADIILPILEALKQGVSIDSTNKLVAGLATLLSPEKLLEYVNSDENGKVEVETVNGAAVAGTGAKIKLLDGNNEIVDTYEVVIYGDANGDGIVDIMDTICLDLYTVEDVNYNYAKNSAQWTALNLDNNGAVDASDVVILDSYANFEGEINQQNPFAG